MAAEYKDFPQMLRESACSMLNDPGTLSEFMVTRALERGNYGGRINLRDAKEFLKNYLTILCESR